jgi:TRAP-type C4-dicarboxylate transport system permease small subunit
VIIINIPVSLLLTGVHICNLVLKNSSQLWKGVDTMVEKTYRKIYSFAEYALEHFATFLFILFFIAVILQVFFRYVLSAPLTWSEEAARYLNVWAVLLGAALAVKRKDHLRVDLIDNLTKKWPMRAQVGFYFFTTFLCFLFVISLIKGSFHMTLDRWSVKLTMLPLPQGMVYLALLVGSLFMFWFFLHQLVSYIRMYVKNKEGGAVK